MEGNSGLTSIGVLCLTFGVFIVFQAIEILEFDIVLLLEELGFLVFVLDDFLMLVLVEHV